MGNGPDWAAYRKGGNENPRAGFGSNRGGKLSYSNNRVEETLESVLSGTRIMAVPEMSLSLEAAQYFKIRSAVSPADGITPVATYLPYYDKYGKLTGFKKRDWTLQKEKTGHFSTVGAVKASSQFFGQHEASMGVGRKQINIVEGEGDVCAAWQAAYEMVKAMSTSPKASKGVKDWADSILKGIRHIQNDEDIGGLPTLPYVGLNCGTANAVDTFANNEKFIRSYEKVVLGFDNDEATALEKEKKIKKGKEATDDVASFLLSENIYVVRYPNERNDPDGFKDIRDMYDAGKVRELYAMFTKADDRYVPDKLIGLKDITIENLRKKKKDGVPLPGLPGLYNLTRGPRTGELWTLTGPSGGGKSTISRKIEYAIIDYLRDMSIPRLDGWTESEKVAIIRLEEDEEESVNSLYAEELKVDPKAFVADPEQFLTEEQHLEIHQRWIREDKIKIFDHFGSIPTDQLIQKLKQMVFLDGCKWIILDHLSMVISGLKSDNERRDLDNIMTELAAFCKKYDVFILSISHMKRKELQLPKDKDGNLLPFWYPVRKEDLRGSAALEQLSWVVLGVEPEELPDRSRGRVRIVVLKNRPHKKLGIADTMVMDDNGQFSDASGWEWEDGMFKLNGEVMLRPQSLIHQLSLETPVGKVNVPAPEYRPTIDLDRTPVPTLDPDDDTPFAPIGLQYAKHAIYVI